ncbi:PTS system mannose/fructose/sorbose family transporter subunit IID [Fundicoccus culcitae]|uniref:PTS system mannose/fructose/sorbose family transporter subunit IID n=1 Tax=Fundicoccus culcitae TaxID=2969821 RepID=A0ABY5P8T2_9LACT|nr:PTS system mannose/fructose/sorbose family transporter subunit IID [Fundicoccus culcitae]UUX35171.1 PTS system mannose/fructose/sorbose family transporter subunit IID [Fundicoccus culcitae]
MNNANKLSKEENKILRQMFIRSHLVFMSFNMVKMEANAFTITMSPAIESIYGDNEEDKKDAYLRSQNFFNTHAVPFNFIAGLTYALEKQRKEKGNIDTATIESIKTSLMGPTAGMFDSLFFNGLRIIAAGIAIGLASQGNILGAILFILLYGVPQSIAKWFLLKWGYVYGTPFIDSVYESGLMNALTKAAGVLGLTMVGSTVAQLVHFPLNWTISIGETELVVQDVFNSIFPGLLSIILVFVLVYLIKKGYRPTTLIIGIIALAMIGALLGIF